MAILSGQDSRDSLKALQIAKILLPAASSKRKDEREQEEFEREDAGALVPADEELLKFSKAMGHAMPEHQ